MVLANGPGPAEATRAGFEELGRRFDRADPEATIVLTPHGVHVEGSFAVVVAGALSGLIDEPPAELECASDPALAGAILDELRADGIPSVGVSYGGNDPAETVMPMDW